MLFCHVASRLEDRTYNRLREDKKLLGLPSLAFLDAEGNVLVQVPFDRRTIAGLESTGRRARDYVRYRAAWEKGTSRERAMFLRMQLEERQLSLEEARAKRRAIGTLDDTELEDALDRLLLHLQISSELAQAGQERRYTLGARFWDMHVNGPRPGPEVSRGYWFAILEWAEREKDAAIFERALDGFRAALEITDPGKPWVAPLLERYDATLRSLKTSHHP
ncbi:MAG: hypothetical protein H6834_09930 [Planctomycetes bacterium]|nr:hypothetical protein [Planctomycetota bacterium]